MVASQRSRKVEPRHQRARDGETRIIWERPEPRPRPTPSRLTRDRIVRTAIMIADKDGLEAVSLRNVGAALGAGPMRLYGYLSSKTELLELMVDALYEEIISAKPCPKGWREALRSIAQRTRQTALAHLWFIELLGGRPHQGPGALAYLEASLAALNSAPGLEDRDAVLLASKIFHAYVIGAIRIEAAELLAERESGMDKSEWRAAMGPYLSRMIQTGKFPTLGKLFQRATHPSGNVIFEQGLECVIDGILARVGSSIRR
jgi:AcrR family transcriptional regulator